MTETVSDNHFDADLLKLLCCPVCRSDLDYIQDKNQLNCTICDASYSVIDGIPVLLSEPVEH